MSLPVTLPARPMPLATLRAVVRAAVAGVRRIRRAIRDRQNLAMLAEAEDHALADIGLNRNDVRDALAQPIWCDPGELLARRAGERAKAMR